MQWIYLLILISIIIALLIYNFTVRRRRGDKVFQCIKEDDKL